MDRFPLTSHLQTNVEQTIVILFNADQFAGAVSLQNILIFLHVNSHKDDKVFAKHKYFKNKLYVTLSTETGPDVFIPKLDSHFVFIYCINDFDFHSKRKMRLLSFFCNENQSHWCSWWEENANQSLGVMTSELVSGDGVTYGYCLMLIKMK